MMAFDRHLSRLLHRASVMLVPVLLLAAGCVTQPAKKAASKSIFYPPPPEQPRLQFLASFSDEQDLGAGVSKFATFITGAAPSSKPIIKPYGALLASNQLYVCDTGLRCVSILDFAQKTLRQFSPPGAGKFGNPINLAVDADGALYVADSGRNQVLCFGADDSLLGVIGEDGSLRPTSVALSSDRIFVTDLKGHCVRVYEKASRKFLFTIPRNPEAAEEQEPGKLFMPVNLAVGPRGQIYVSDFAACRIKIFDAEGKLLRSLGSQGDLPGQFARPKGLAVDQAGRIFVVDAATQVCQIFDAEGKLLLFFGEPDASVAPLNLPAGVSVDVDHVGLFQKLAAPGFVLEELVLITNQYGQRKVNVYGLGHMK